VELSSAELEYMASSLATCEAIWINKLLIDFFSQELDVIVIHCDN
jgi:hypothetical protein